jgi:hypothetical protein
MSEKLEEIRKKYANAYRLAGLMDAVGRLLYIFSSLVFLGGCMASAEADGGGAQIIIFIVAVCICVGIIVVGIIVQGFSAALQATADTAVHTARVLMR